LAVINFPHQEKIFLDDGGLSIFSLEEIRQRIEHRIEWIDISNHPDGIDLILRTSDGAGLILVFLDADKSSDDIRLEKLRQRLELCLKDITSRRFWLPHCDFSQARKSIEIVSAQPLMEDTKQIKALRDKIVSGSVLPVEFLDQEEFRERHGFVPRDLPSLRDRY
jgi:hypothetical protein